MAAILKTFTPEQETTLGRDKVIADNVGLTNWNQGTIALSIMEAFALIASMTMADMAASTRKAIPVALYDGLGFTRKGAQASTGFLTFFRLPLMLMRYTGSGASCLLTITGTTLTTTTGVGPDDLSIDLTVHTTILAVVTQISLNAAYTASVITGNNDILSSTLYDHIAVDIKSKINYLGTPGAGITADGVTTATIPLEAQVEIDNVRYKTSSTGSIPAGFDSSGGVAAICMEVGAATNRAINALDTINGKGSMVTGISGVEHAANRVAFSGGQTQESDEERARRFQTEVQGLVGSSTYKIEAALLKQVPTLRSVTVLNNYPQNGVVTIVADRGDGSLSSDDIDLMRKVVEGDPNDLVTYPGVGTAGITYNYIAPTVQGLNVVITVTRIGTLSDTDEIELAVATAISNYVNTRRLGDDVVHSALVTAAKTAHPAIYDIAVPTPAANVPIALGSVAKTGFGGFTITVNINTVTSTP